VKIGQVDPEIIVLKRLFKKKKLTLAEHVARWAGMPRGLNTLLLPLLGKIFSLPATSAPMERIFSHSGLLMRPNKARMGIKLLCQLVYLCCNSKL